MKMEQEITVLVNTKYLELQKRLMNAGFRIKDSYEMIDQYMINKDIDITNMDNLDILKHCILVRNIIGIEQELLYKHKKYAPNGDILEEYKTKCLVMDSESAIEFMRAINYEILFTINDLNIIYTNGKTELAIQYVNNKHIFIEMEANEYFNSIESMKEELDSYNLPYDQSDYFAKKAVITLEEMKKKNKLKKKIKENNYEK